MLLRLHQRFPQVQDSQVPEPVQLPVELQAEQYSLSPHWLCLEQEATGERQVFEDSTQEP